MKRRMGRGPHPSIALLLALLPAQRLMAQENGPIILGEQQKHNWLTLGNYHGSLELLYRNQNDQIDPKDGSPKSEFNEDRFQETLSLSSNGAIYHPNLVELNLAGSFGLTQDRIDATGQSDSQFGTIYDWDASATILRKEIAPLTLYTRRNNQLISRELGPTLESTVTTAGAIWDIRSKSIPTRIEAYHSEQEQTGPADAGNFNLSQYTVVWHSEAHPTTNQLLSWDYSFNSVDEQTADLASDSFMTHDASLVHSVDFGKDRRSNLTSSLNYFDQSGDFDLQRMRLNERLRVHHSDTFETRYDYSLDQQSFSGTDQTTNRATAGFLHKLYKSLTTTGEIGGQQITRSDDANTIEVFADLNFDYRKKVPFGKLSSALGVSWDRQENDDRSGTTQIFDQPLAFADPAPIILPRAGIPPGSVNITDAMGLVVYRPGLDYTLRSFPDHLEIDRIIGGSIANGQTVLVDYQLSPEAANTVTNNGFNISARYDIDQGALKGLAIYARYRKQDQTIDASSTSLLIPNSFDDTIYGVEYSIWHVIVSAERENYDATISPFDATRFDARYTQRLNPDTTATVNANYTTLNYTDEDNRIGLWIVSAQLQHNFTRELQGYVTVLYRQEDDDLRGPTRGWEEQVELQWHHRQVYVYGMLRNSHVDTDFQSETF
ncbi:MAG TPA: hypothetical protein VHD56_06425, partial [Tepidisphaeraceae bacterium]|nr:hypothetical protein [Tepidisphaeraceae bacterium]